MAGEETKPSAGGDDWVLPDSAARFAAWVTDAFAPVLRDDGGGDEDLFPQQRFVRAYLSHSGPFRGLVLYHGLGSGKTCSAIAAAEALRLARDEGRRRRIIVMLPASLRRNYVGEVRKCGARDFREAQRWRRRAGAPAGEPKWEAVADGTPYADLPPRDQAEVRAELDAAIGAVHRVVAYNAVPGIAALMREERPFDDAVVIVDEAHNFISRVVNERQLTRVYDALMDAARCKLVLLSGTPLVNRPEELAALVNLAHGPVRVHQFTTPRRALDAETAAALRALPEVAEFFEAAPHVAVRFWPEGFARAAREGYVRRLGADEPGATTADAVRRVRAALGDAPAPKHRDVLLLPADAATFRAAFLTRDGRGVRNTATLERRMLGLVSFFGGHDPALYPAVRSVTLRRSPMSARQFTEYVTHRGVEIKREAAARRFAAARAGAGGDDDGFASYRAFSRVVCNFAFPADVPRPTRADVRGALDEAAAAQDTAGDDADAVSPAEGLPPVLLTAARPAREVTARYVAALEAAIEAVAQEPGRLALEGGGLEELSPKFAAVVRDVAALRDGTALVYSQFVSVEGVALLARALLANGFDQLHLARARPERPGAPAGELGLTVQQGAGAGAGAARPRFLVYSNQDPEIATATLALFNNRLGDLPPGVLDAARRGGGGGGGGRSSKRSASAAAASNLRGDLARVLLITASGAEGITTRNVRRVHILEPFWHSNRVEQVIGRAVRAHSHDDLPAPDRTVDVTIHLAAFTPDQANTSLVKKDQGQTSDEYVHAVAQKKRAVLTGLLDAMRAAAVDCRLHAERHAAAAEARARMRGKGKGKPPPLPPPPRCWAPLAGEDEAAPAWRAETLDDEVARAASGADARADTPLTRVVLADGRVAFHDPATDVVYDAEALMGQRKRVEIGMGRDLMQQPSTARRGGRRTRRA